MTSSQVADSNLDGVDVGELADFPVGQFTLVSVAGREIGLLRTETGAVHAVLNHCPHRGAPVCLGRVIGTMHSDRPGTLDYDPEELVLFCPWHGWEFNLESGRALGGVSRSRLATFPVSVEDGRVLVRLRRGNRT